MIPSNLVFTAIIVVALSVLLYAAARAEGGRR